MPPQDTPPTPPEPDDDEFWTTPIFRDPQTGEIDHRRTLLATLEKFVAGKPPEYWAQRSWQAEFLDDPTSAVTGERCAARFVLSQDGERRALVEFRPGQTASPISETQGPQLMWFVGIGKRKPKGYVNLSWALAAAMGLRRRDMWDNRYLHEWLTNGDARAFLRLQSLEDQRDRRVDEFWRDHWRRP